MTTATSGPKHALDCGPPRSPGSAGRGERHRGAAGISLVLAACVLGACSGPPREDEPPDTTRFGDHLGLVVKFSQGEPETDLQMLPDLGVHWVRDALEWAEIEPAPGSFAGFSPSLQRRLAFYLEHDIGLVALLSLENAAAYPPDPANPGASSDPEAFGRYAAWCASQLQALGIRFVLELGNEPHNSPLPKVFGGTWNGHPPSPWVDHYAQMVRAAVAAVKQSSPSTALLTDDDMWILHYWFLDAGLPRDLDGFAVHPYSKTPEETAVGPDTDWTRPFTVVDADRSFASAVGRLARRGSEKLGHQPQVWVTEWGWPVDNGAHNSVAESQQADYLPRAFVLSVAAGVRAMCWFSSQDTVDGPMGLQDNQGNRRAAYLAFKTLNSELGQSRLVGQLRPPGSAGGVYAFLFAEDRQRHLILWNRTEGVVPVLLPGSQTDSVVDTLGRPVPYAADPGGVARIAVSPAPIYVSGRWSDAELRTAIGSVAGSRRDGR